MRYRLLCAALEHVPHACAKVKRFHSCDTTQHAKQTRRNMKRGDVRSLQSANTAQQNATHCLRLGSYRTMPYTVSDAAQRTMQRTAIALIVLRVACLSSGPPAQPAPLQLAPQWRSLRPGLCVRCSGWSLRPGLTVRCSGRAAQWLP